ncbi:mediator of DNA damage checkpoint protein 1-like protein [Zopfochytrium polystomum]|nr:mediator of DNA damage checkpoint protein 1-like protein [Zopfochytrium polystomum]
MFTGIAETETYESIVFSLGGETVQTWSECTHLVTDKIRRTVKFLAALAAGKHIVSVKWLEQSKKSSVFVDVTDHLLKDKAAEKVYGFSLKESLEKAKAQRLFAGVEVYATPSVKPPHADLAEMLIAAGSKLIKSVPAGGPANHPHVAVIGCAEDEAACRKLQRAGWRVLTNEFVLTGILRQEVGWDEHVLAFGGAGGGGGGGA